MSEVPQMRLYEREPHVWEMAAVNPDPLPAPEWELCTSEIFAARQPEMFRRWEDHTEHPLNVSDESPAELPPSQEIARTTDIEPETVADHDEILVSPQVVTAMLQAETVKRRKRRQKTRYEDMSPVRKAVRIAGVGAAITAFTLPCTADTSTPDQYIAPYWTLANAEHCPPGATTGAFSVAGVGNNKISLYSAQKEQEMMAKEENQLPEEERLCYGALVYGTDYDPTGNMAVLHDFIEKNNLKQIIIFAFSFGGIATVDMLNEFHAAYPDSDVQFAVVYVSSPGEFDDLQPAQQGATKALSLVPLDTATVKWMTYFSIVGQGDKNPVDEQVAKDTDIAAKDTPPRLLWGETIRLLFGMSKSDMDITASIIYDQNDKVVIMPRALQTIPERSGVPFFRVIPMTHTDHRMNNHAAIWWPANYDDYKDPVRLAIEANVKEFTHKETLRALRECAMQARAIPNLAC